MGKWRKPRHGGRLVDLTSFARVMGIGVPVKATQELWDELKRDKLRELREALEAVDVELRTGDDLLPGEREERLLGPSLRMRLVWDASNRPEVRLGLPTQRLGQAPTEPDAPEPLRARPNREVEAALRRVVDHYWGEEQGRYHAAPSRDHIFGALRVLDRYLGGNRLRREVATGPPQTTLPSTPPDELRRRGPKP